MARKERPATVAERIVYLRERLDELRRAGTASNATLEILAELTEIIDMTNRRLR